MSDASLPPRRGWTVFCAPDPATDIEFMPPELQTALIQFLTTLGLEAGAAIDSGKQPPGVLVDELVYSLTVPGEPVFFEYLVMTDIRELRVTSLIWLR